MKRRSEAPAPPLLTINFRQGRSILWTYMADRVVKTGDSVTFDIDGCSIEQDDDGSVYIRVLVHQR